MSVLYYSLSFTLLLTQITSCHLSARYFIHQDWQHLTH